MKKFKLPAWSYPPLAIVFWIALWWIIAVSFGKPLLLPTPLSALRALFALAKTASFYATVLLSLLRILLGILLAMLAGVALALLTAKSRFFYHLFSPLLNLFKATPVASVIFLMLLWVGRDGVPCVIAFVMALPIVWSNVNEGLTQTDNRLLEMARVFNVPASKILTKKIGRASCRERVFV